MATWLSAQDSLQQNAGSRPDAASIEACRANKTRKLNGLLRLSTALRHQIVIIGQSSILVAEPGHIVETDQTLPEIEMALKNCCFLTPSRKELCPQRRLEASLPCCLWAVYRALQLWRQLGSGILHVGATCVWTMLYDVICKPPWQF